ncbi:hypothetical protein [Sphingobacterium ginsenosidimutans]|uniref:Uncharacterized protein n=1 Tax=Sphingobacterium ginsenosidimutans TaxID=687845 RepID=A0ABP8AHH6_9SPHI
MKHHKLLYVALFLFIALISCKKENLSSGYWEELAIKKRKEIEQLITSKKATDKEEWYVKKAQNYWCGESYFAMHKSLEKDFDRLWQDYRDLVKKGFDAGIKEGIIYEPCDDYYWYEYSPLELVVENQKAKLIFAQDLSAEKCRELLPDLKKKMDDYQNQLNCTGIDKWDVTPILGCYNTYLPFSRANDYSEIKRIVSLYNALYLRLSSLERPVCTQGPTPKFKSLTCENGKPKVNYTWN